jgi:hypothetical protein
MKKPTPFEEFLDLGDWGQNIDDEGDNIYNRADMLKFAEQYFLKQTEPIVRLLRWQNNL